MRARGGPELAGTAAYNRWRPADRPSRCRQPDPSDIKFVARRGRPAEDEKCSHSDINGLTAHGRKQLERSIMRAARGDGGGFIELRSNCVSGVAAASVAARSEPAPDRGPPASARVTWRIGRLTIALVISLPITGRHRAPHFAIDQQRRRCARQPGKNRL